MIHSAGNTQEQNTRNELQLYTMIYLIFQALHDSLDVSFKYLRLYVALCTLVATLRKQP